MIDEVEVALRQRGLERDPVPVRVPEVDLQVRCRQPVACGGDVAPGDGDPLGPACFDAHRQPFTRLRIQQPVGLEDARDLITDLDTALAAALDTPTTSGALVGAGAS